MNPSLITFALRRSYSCDSSVLRFSDLNCLDWLKVRVKKFVEIPPIPDICSFPQKTLTHYVPET